MLQIHNWQPGSKDICHERPTARICLWVFRHSLYKCWWGSPGWLQKGHDSGWILWVFPNQNSSLRSSWETDKWHTQLWTLSRSGMFKPFFSVFVCLFLSLDETHEGKKKKLHRVPQHTIDKSEANLTDLWPRNFLSPRTVWKSQIAYFSISEK